MIRLLKSKGEPIPAPPFRFQDFEVHTFDAGSQIPAWCSPEMNCGGDGTTTYCVDA